MGYYKTYLMKTLQKKETMQRLMWDIIVDIKWTNISTKYFGKSRSWLSQKMNGIDGNGSETKFSDEEKKILKEGLEDLAKRIRVCANKI